MSCCRLALAIFSLQTPPAKRALKHLPVPKDVIGIGCRPRPLRGH